MNNILIYYYYSGGKLYWKALLVDWAFCKYKHELGLEVVQKTRSVGRQTLYPTLPT